MKRLIKQALAASLLALNSLGGAWAASPPPGATDKVLIVVSSEGRDQGKTGRASRWTSSHSPG